MPTNVSLMSPFCFRQREHCKQRRTCFILLVRCLASNLSLRKNRPSPPRATHCSPWQRFTKTACPALQHQTEWNRHQELEISLHSTTCHCLSSKVRPQPIMWEFCSPVCNRASRSGSHSKQARIKSQTYQGSFLAVALP